MSKDDYIRFRCSSELKKLAENNAKEKGLSLTDYMEYLVRKDRDNMMYVFSGYGIDDDDFYFCFQKIIENGLGVKLGDEYILSKSDKIIVDGKVFQSNTTLEKFISGFDGGESITIIDGLEITKEDVLDTFIGELEQPCNDNGETYMDVIYNSENPYQEIEKFINVFLGIQIDFKMTDIKMRVREIQEEIGNGNVSWN